MRQYAAICLTCVWLSLSVSGANPASHDEADPRKLIGYFALAGNIYRLRVVGEQFFVQRWSREGFLNEWFALAAGAEGEIDRVTVLDGDDIEVQLSTRASGVQIWGVNVDLRRSVIQPRLVWAGTPGPSDAGWATYHVQEDIHVATNGSVVVAIERGVVRTVEPRVYSTDGASGQAYFAAATGHGLAVWHVVEGQLRFDAARDYNLNVAQVAALEDGGWLMLTTHGGAVQLIDVDRSLLPRWLLPMPGGVAWELHELGGGVVVAAGDEPNAWLIAGGKCQRFEWTKTSPSGEVVPSDAANFVRLTDGTTVGEPHTRRLVAMQSVTGLWVGPKWLIVSRRERQRAIVIAVVMLLLVVGSITAWRAGRARGKRFGSSRP